MLHILVDKSTSEEIRDLIASRNNGAIEIEDVFMEGDWFTDGMNETMTFEDTETNTVVDLVSRNDLGDLDDDGNSNLWEIVIFPGFSESVMIADISTVLSNKDRKELAQKLSDVSEKISSLTEDFNNQYKDEIAPYLDEDDED